MEDYITGFMRASCDGSSLSNPGPAGAGIHLECSMNNGMIDISWPLGKQDNAAAEYEAIILALKVARALGCTELKIESDHESLVDQLRPNGKHPFGRLFPLWAQAMNLVREFPVGVQFEWVSRTSGNHARANELAGQAAGSNPVGGLNYAKDKSTPCGSSQARACPNARASR